MFTDLILLIGTNPLPNYVVGKYFIDNNSELERIWFVYSITDEADKQANTYVYADSLMEIFRSLNNRIKYKPIPISDVTDAQVIRQSIFNIKHELERKRIHLNYTGGTKVMVANIYYVLGREFKEDVEFSYLSAKDFKIYYDITNERTNNLLNIVNITLKELFSLHQLVGKPNEAVFNTKKFADPIINYVMNHSLEQIKSENYELKSKLKNPKKQNNCGTRIKHINQYWADFRPSDFAKMIDDNTEDNKKVFNENGTKRAFISDKYLEEYLDFYGGKWFEIYIYGILKSKYGKNPNINLYSNVKAKKKNSVNDFEIDVLIIKGYQLIGISITTSNERDIVKKKGFEIINRSWQMGGDEAKSVLISFMKNEHSIELKNELSFDTGNAKDSLLCLGIDKLIPGIFVNEITNFIGE